MNEGIFTSRKVRTLPGMEEERRLAFVALTRAEQGLYLSASNGGTSTALPAIPPGSCWTSTKHCSPSSFRHQEGLIRAARDYIDHSQQFLSKEESAAVFPAGQRVRHPLFGEGTVLDSDRDKGAHLVQFDTMDTPRQISFRAKLERC